MKQNLFVMLSLLSSSKAIKVDNSVSIGTKMREIEARRFHNNSLIQTQDWSGDILGLVDSADYVKDVASSLEEQELNITFEQKTKQENNPALEGMTKKKEEVVLKEPKKKEQPKQKL